MFELRRIISNTVISLIGQAISWLSTILLSFAYGHFLGASKFGELYFAITFVAIIGVVVDSGYGNQTIRDVVQEPTLAARYFSNILLIKISTWLITYSIILLISWLMGYALEMRILIAISGFDLLCNAVVNTFVSMHYAFKRAIFPVVGDILEKGLTSLLGVLLLSSGAGVQVMAMVLGACSLVNGIWQAIWYFRLVGTSFTIDLKLIGEMVRTNIPFLISGVLGVAYVSIDAILLSQMTNSAVVGWYGAATRITYAMGFLPSIVIMNIMYPVLSKLSTTADADVKLAIEKSINFLLFCGIPITTMLIVAAPNIIGFLYGSGFTQSVPALQMLAPYVIFLYINYAVLAIILSRKQDKIVPIASGVAVVFNIGLNLVLIPHFQHIGTAIVTSLTELLLTGIAFSVIPRNLQPFKSLPVAFKSLIASMIMAGAILFLHISNIFVILLVALVVYLGVAFLLGTIPREDYQAVFSALRSKKVQPDSEVAENDLLEDSLAVHELITSPFPSVHSDPLLAYELMTTLNLPAIRRRPAGRKSERQPLLRAIRLQPMPSYVPIQDGHDKGSIREKVTDCFGEKV